MTHTHRPRSRRRHRHSEDQIFDSAGFLALAEVAREDSERELLTAKANLATQLERLDDALDAAFEVLTPAEFTSLVWRLENPGRTRFLRDLNMPSAKKPTLLAATHGLARLHRWPAAKRLDAARFITIPTLRELADPLMAWLEGRADDALTMALLEDPGQANAVRLMVLAHWYDSPDVAAALRAVLTRGLALPTWPADVVDDIAAACATLEPLWLAATIGQTLDERDGETDDGAASPAMAAEWGARNGSNDEASGAASPREPGMLSASTDHPPATSLIAGPAEALTAAAVDVRRALEAARAVAHQIAGDLDAGQVPSTDLQAPITKLAGAVGHARSLLADAHAASIPDTCDELATVLENAATSVRDDGAAQDRLTRLTLLAGPASHQGVIDGVRDLARALLDDTPWDEAQCRHVHGLAALLDLIDAVATSDTSGIMKLHSMAQQSLPDDLASVLVIALLGQLTALSADTATTVEDPTKFTVTDASARSAASNTSPRLSSAPDLDTGSPGVTADAGTAPTTPPDRSPGIGARVGSLHELAERTQDNAPDESSGAAATHTDHSTTTDAPAEDTAAPTADPSATDGAALLTIPEYPTTDSVSSGNQPGTDVTGDQLLASLLNTRRYCLAFHAAQALGRDTSAKALRVLAFAEAVRSETGPTAVALRTALGELHLHHFDDDRPAHVALLAAAVRAALVTADPNAGEVVTGLVNTLHDLPHVATLSGAIGTASARGLLSSSTMLVALAPLAGADNDIAVAAEAAAVERDRPRTLRFQRANVIVAQWWSRTGRIGRALDIAANDRRADVDLAANTLRELAKREDIQQALARDDAKVRGHGSRPMEGAARRRLIDHARESLDAVGAWVDAVRANFGNNRASLQVPTNLAALRNRVRAEWTGAVTELQALAATRSDVLLAASATACWQSLQRSVELLDGKSLQGAEPVPDEVLNRELLRCPTLRVDATLTPTRQVTLDEIETATLTSWTEAFNARLTDEDYAAARVIVDAVSEQDSSSVGEMLEQLEQNTARTRAELRSRRAEVVAQVEKAARLGQLDQAAYTEVLAQLEAARPGRDDLGAVRAQLDDLSRRLPAYAKAAKEALWERVTAELNKAASEVKVADNAAELIKDRIDAGDLATAEEYLLSALVGEDPPSVTPSGHLTAFMAVPDALPGGIFPALVKAARSGGTAAGLDFSGLSETDRAAAADGLDVWLDLRSDRQLRSQRTRYYYSLAPALRLAGIEFTGDRPPHGLLGSPNRRWVDLTGVKRVGDPLVPAFGSLTGKPLRVLLCWGAQDARTLLTWVAQDQSDIPVVVALFGTLPRGQRRALAKACAERQDKPVVVLDDAALAYLAAYGRGRFASTERILLPFAATNPYHPNATGKVPSEMFYGRRDERGKLLDPYGTSLLYGGRQLGKSALLQAAARHFELTVDRVAVYLSLPGGFGATRSADDLWDMIADLLVEREITIPRRRSRDAVKHVDMAIKTWLGQNPNRRLMLLLDECDGFFDADAKTNFTHTSRLRDLMNETERRFKPVFAGLHQVQRFAHLPNQPLAHAHFGDPIAIGPLSPDPAYGLMFTPMEALGISFASDELIHRVLAYCNYQPKLLQLVGEALVRESFNRRDVGGPPYVIGDEELERVIGSDTVKQKVRDSVQLTLNLDSRYKLIALVVALDALERGADHTIGTTRLREQCLEWWPDGFTGQGADEFRSLLEEMRGLGVLADTGGRWRLRSSNVLRLLGSAEDIADELCGEEWRKTPTALSAEQARRDLADGTASPMTEKQFATVTGRGNRLRVVVGTPATGIDRVVTLLQEEVARTGAKFTLHQATSPASYRKELRGGEPIDGHRVVLCDLSHIKQDNALAALRQAEDLLPSPGVTRSVIALVDASLSSVFSLLGDPDLDARPRSDIADRLVSLRRLTSNGIRSWAAALTESHQISCFSDTASQNLLMETTGGWLPLLDDVIQLAAGGRSARKVCELVTTRLGTAEAAEALIQATGLAGHSRLATAFQELINYGDPVTGDDLVVLFDQCGGERSATLLHYLDVIVQRSEDGMWGPERVLAAAWKVARR